VEIQTLVVVATFNAQGLGNNARNKNRTNLEIAELGELFAAFIETAEVGLGLIVDDLVGTYVSTLGKSLAADFTSVWAFSGVSSFVSLSRCVISMAMRSNVILLSLTLRFPS
jgi:hypothetical protein